MLVDSHCHIQSEEFDRDRQQVISRCEEQSIRCVVVGNRREDSEQAVELARDFSCCYAAVGLHPMFISEEDWDPEHYRALFTQPKTVAVGEIGLDYHHIWADTEEEEHAAREEQQEIFRRQLAFAKELQKPVVIHCRDAYEDVWTILKEFPGLPVVMHTYLGTTTMAEKFLAYGAYISFSGIITFGNDPALLKTVTSVPLDRMLIETDAPYLTSVPYRGKRNEPIYVAETAKKVAELHGVSFEDVAQRTTENAERFFRFPQSLPNNPFPAVTAKRDPAFLG